MIYDSRARSNQPYERETQRVPSRRLDLRTRIGMYTPSAVEYLPYDSASHRVAKRIAEVVVQSDASVLVEHIGSTAVPGCWGKGIVDLLVVYPPGGLEAARDALDRLGFQKQGGSEPFPESRPMRVGSVEYFGRRYRMHAHVIESGSDEARNLVRFRDLLRQNCDLRRAYEAEKRAILARGIVTGTEYSNAKGQFIRGVLAAEAGSDSFGEKPGGC